LILPTVHPPRAEDACQTLEKRLGNWD